EDPILINLRRSVACKHIPRENNQAADAIAKLALGRKEDLQILDSPPGKIQEILHIDR
ncbi:hypothetical protein Golax_005612, partial [Gossypium laxum]|nr:hypothetical protein [Gossypium laxum]